MTLVCRHAAVAAILGLALSGCAGFTHFNATGVGSEITKRGMNGLGRLIACARGSERCPDQTETAVAPAAGPAPTPAAGYQLSPEEAQRLCLAYPEAQRPEECEQVLAQD